MGKAPFRGKLAVLTSIYINYIYVYNIIYIYIISVGVSGSWGLVHIPAISNTSAIHQNTFSMYDI
jgi:hypothetical protein